MHLSDIKYSTTHEHKKRLLEMFSNLKERDKSQSITPKE